jgi:hypothetical protein
MGASMCEILNRFRTFFGQQGGDQVPSNIGAAQIVALCREALESPNPELFDYYTAWHETPEVIHGIRATSVGTAIQLKQNGMWEAAWDVCQLHFDQTQKREAANSVRLNKGDPACGMAILGQVFGSHALTRHFAQLSSAGDVYWEHELPILRDGGLAPLLMEAYESGERHNLWRKQVRERISQIPTEEPRYLEPSLLMRWFGEAYWDLFWSASGMAERQGRTFVDVILDLVEDNSTNQRGKLFEAATALLFSATPGFEVRSARTTNDQQIDIVVRYEPDPLTILPIEAGPGLVECKSSGNPVTVSELRDFGSKCLFHRVKFGVMVARAHITGYNLFDIPHRGELVRRRFLLDGLTILVIDISDLRGRARDLRGLQEPLAADHDNLVFGPIDGESGI